MNSFIDGEAMKLTELLVPWIAILFSIMIAFWLKDFAQNFMIGLKFRMNTAFNEGDKVISLTDALKNDVDPVSGKHVYTPLVALSLMVFYVYAAQCMATFAVVRRETNSWKWPMVMIVYMTGLAYFASLIVSTNVIAPFGNCPIVPITSGWLF